MHLAPFIRPLALILALVGLLGLIAGSRAAAAGPGLSAKATSWPVGAGLLNMPPDSSLQLANFSTTAIQRDGIGGERWYYGSAQKRFILVNYQWDSNGNGILEPLVDGWKYLRSKRAIDMGSAAHGGPVSGTAAMGTVLSYPSKTYVNARDGLGYSWVMYFVWQKVGSAGAGELCASFSNDGITWVRPISVVRSASAEVPYCSEAAEPILVEAVSGFHRTANTIHLFYLNGRVSEVAAEFKPEGSTLTGTETYLVTTSPATPHVVSTVGEVTPAGVTVPPTGSSSAWHHAAFANLNAAFNPATGAVYLTRAYAWPATTSETQDLCNTGVCPDGVATLPNRAQMLCMNVGGAVWKTTASGMTWVRLLDHGRNQSTDGWGDGWDIQDATCHQTSTAHSDALPAEDYENLDIVKTLAGHVWEQPGYPSPYHRFEFVYGIQPNKKLQCNTLQTTQDVTQVNQLVTSYVIRTDCTSM